MAYEIIKKKKSLEKQDWVSVPGNRSEGMQKESSYDNTADVDTATENFARNSTGL